MSVLDTLVTDRTEGARYGAEDLNRVGQAARYVAALMTARGYPVVVTAAEAPENWTMQSYYMAEDGERLIAALERMRGNLGVERVSVLPESMQMLSYVGANEIEQFLLDAAAVLEDIVQGWVWRQCGVNECGGMLL